MIKKRVRAFVVVDLELDPADTNLPFVEGILAPLLDHDYEGFITGCRVTHMTYDTRDPIPIRINNKETPST